jgi:hypothetical protein
MSLFQHNLCLFGRYDTFHHHRIPVPSISLHRTTTTNNKNCYRQTMGRPKGSKNRPGHKAGGFRANSGRKMAALRRAGGATDFASAAAAVTDAASAAETAAVVAAAVVEQATTLAGAAAAGAGAGVDGLLPPEDDLEPLPPLGSIEDSARGQKRKASADPDDGAARAARSCVAATAAAKTAIPAGGAPQITADEQWQNMFQELQRYAEANGGSTYVKYTPANRSLYHWCHNQCTQYRNLARLAAGLAQSSARQYTSSMTPGRIDALKSIGFDLEQRTGGGAGANETKWNARYELLVKYKNDHGGICHDIPYTYILSDANASSAGTDAGFKKLGKWCDRQRYWYRLLREGKKSQMTEERAEKLEGLAFVGPAAVAAGAKPEVAGTVLPAATAAASAAAASGTANANADASGVSSNKHTAKWEASFAELLEYKRVNGNCMVKYNYEANPKLARWVDRQRYWYKMMTSSKKSQMTEERAQRLREAGFVFSLRGGGGGGKAGSGERGGDAERDEDNAGFNQVQTAAAAAAVADGSVEGEPGRPTGNTTHASQQTKWEVRLQELLDYERRTGSLAVPHKYPENQALANWVEKQKNELRLKSEGKPSQMTDEREERLVAIGFTFTSRATVWSERMEALRAYKAQYGHCRVPYTYAKDPKLAKWVSKQRSEMKSRREGRKTQMTVERIVELRELDFWGPGEDDGSTVPHAEI